MRLTRRTFVTALGAAGAAGAAAPSLAGEAPHVSPKRRRPVRATHNGLPYFDFTGATEPYRPAKAKRLDETALTPSQKWLLGIF